MPEIFKRPYDYLLRYDPLNQNVYRADGIIPISPNFLSGLTIQTNFQFSNGSEQNGYVLMSDSFGNASWQPSGVFTGGTISGDTIFTGNLSANTFSATTYLNLPTDTNTYTTAFTYNNNNTFIIFDNSGNTFDATINDVTGLTINGDLIVTGNTFLDNVSANTISATTYLNLPTDSNTFVTAFTYNNNTFTIFDNSGNTFDVTINDVTGLTVNGNLTVTGNTLVDSLSADSITLISTPTTANTETSFLVRNSTTGLLQIRTVDSIFDVKNQVTVGLSGSVGVDFNSIKDAVDSITGSSSTNVFVVKVGPGLYNENPITLKPYVAIIGESSVSTVVNAINPNQSLFNAVDNSFLSDLLIQGCTGTNVSAVLYSSSTVSAANAIVYIENVRFGANYTHVKNSPFGGGNTAIQCTNIKYGAQPFTLGFYMTSDGVSTGRFQLRNVTTTAGGVANTSGLTFAKVDQPNCTIIGNLVTVTKAGSAPVSGIGFHVENGGLLRLNTFNIQRFGTGIYVPQVGSAPTIDAVGLNFENCATDVDIIHSGTTGKVNGTDSFLKTKINIDAPLYEVNKDPRQIIVAKKGGDFSSIKSAVDYLAASGNTSSSNRFVINVGPGVFIEDEIDLTNTPYVSVVGSNIQTTQIVPSGSTHHIVKIGQSNELSFLSFSGAGLGYAAVYAYDIGNFAQLHKVSIYDCDTGVWVESNTQDTILYGEYVDMNGNFTYGTKAVGNNGYLALANMENYYSFPTDIVAQVSNYVTGSGSTINVSSATLEGNGLSGSCAFLLQDGGFINIASTDIVNYGYGVRILNVGNSSSFEINGTTFTDNIFDLNVEQISASGVLQGIADHTKVLSISDNVFWSFLDSGDGELDITRKGSVTFQDGSHTDFTTLIFEGSTMGLMSGGTISAVSAFTVNTQAGYGYLETSADVGIIRRIDWVDTTITLSANTENYIFINENSTLSSSGSIPNTFFNILMGRVVTNSTGIEFIEQSPQNANHTSNRFSTFNRTALGPVYATGSIVTEGTTPFTLDVSAGDYFFSENQFMPSGGTPITFTQYYRDGLGGWITSATTGVTNSFYDGNGVLSGLTGYTKHTLYVVGDGIDEKYFLVLGQNEYSTLVQTEGALLPTPPTYFDDAVTQIASVYVQGGTTGITQIEDIRPVIGFKAGGVNASSLHANLLGLSSDDHLQYLLVNGGRAMAGNLDMGSNDITNVNLVDGVDVSSHATRHQFGGLDPVGTTTPTANAIPYADVSGKLDSWITPITISGGTGILTGGTYPNFSITNTLPDQTVTISGGTGILTGGTYPNFEITNTAPDQTVTISGGTGILTGGTYPNFEITNTLPDLTVTLTDGTGISTSGTYPNFTITNTLPDQTVTISGGTGITTGGTYPNFSITNNSPDQIVTISGGTGILTGGTYPNFEITNAAPDQVVVLNNGTGISTSGTYPNFTITNTLPDQTVTISGGTGITTGGTYPNFSITNNAPDQIVTISEGTGMSVTGTYPNFTIANTGETYVTGVTYSANTLTVSQNGGQSAINTTIGLRIKSGTVTAGSFAGNPRTTTITFTTAYPNTSYSIGITGSDNRTFTYSNKTTTGFTISSNANTNLTGNVDWQTIAYGES